METSTSHSPESNTQSNSSAHETQDTERASRLEVIRIIGTTALGHIGNFARTSVDRVKQGVHDRIDARSKQKLFAELDYNLSTERDVDNLRTDTTEILGGNPGLLKGRYARKTETILGKIDKAEAKKDVPTRREDWLKYRDNRTDIKIARIQDKVNNSGKGILSNHLNRQRRMRLRELQYRKKVIAHSVGKLDQKRKEKPEELQKKIDVYVRKKVDAEYRRELRRNMRRNGVRKHNVMKRAEFETRLSPQKKREIVREAIKQVRKKNIKRGLLDSSYEIDNSANARKVNDEYRRTIE